ncbi:peptidylprolyl isomerase [Paraglaciecola aquimarina]|uniref:Peptidyl-prolyl cis-trans isomerase n=1 Tax=Paraglaciecola algarum TaxID=3050085 RepID=A0ABS9DAB1_9ALTE|nr:peptidylprolyl isomerase [Paraglaciecola sp. G1-23]MCF2949337.1 peptidylprolyl isomerase [Paraglaciecola sp. G1-23]
MIKKTQFSIITAIAFALVLTSCDLFTDQAVKQANQFIQQQNIDKQNKDWKTSLPQPPELTFSQDKKYLWLLTTNKGDITIELMPKVAPMHVSSTIFLTRVGFYDDVIFHRIIPGFMAQGGDPTGTGRGNPGYKYAGEFNDEVKHTEAGLLSMANSGPNTDGCQFFLTFKATPWLDGKHTIFGKVTKGLEVLKSFEQFGSARGTTTEEVKIVKAIIEVK